MSNSKFTYVFQAVEADVWLLDRSLIRIRAHYNRLGWANEDG